MINSGIVQNFFNNFDIIKYPLIVGILLSITASILGVVLVLKRYSMIGDGLSHVSFGVYAVAIGLGLTDAPILIVIPLVVLAAYFIAKPRLNGWILVIDIVKLNLYEFDLRMFGKYHIQHVGTVVEGKSEMPYLALLL